MKIIDNALRNRLIFERGNFTDICVVCRRDMLLEFKRLIVALHDFLVDINLRLSEISDDALNRLQQLRTHLIPSEKLILNESIIETLDGILQRILKWRFGIDDNLFNTKNDFTEYFRMNRDKIENMGAKEYSYLKLIIKQTREHIQKKKSDRKLNRALEQLRKDLKKHLDESMKVHIAFSHLYGQIITGNEINQARRLQLFISCAISLKDLKKSLDIDNFAEAVAMKINEIRPIVKLVNEQQHMFWRNFVNCIQNNECHAGELEQEPKKWCWPCRR